MAKRRLTEPALTDPKDLPQRENVWQVDARRLDAPVDVGDQAVVRPWTVVVASETNDRVLAMVLMPSPPTPEAIWQTVVRAMTKPTKGKPHRPTEVQTRRMKKLLALQPLLSGLGIRFTTRKRLPVIEQVVEEILEDMAGDDEPGLLDMPGVTPKRVKCLFEAAAEFYRKAPWKKVVQRIIKVECPKSGNAPWYAMLLGRNGTPPGLMLYDRLEIPHLDGQDGDETSALAVLFGEKEDLPGADLEAVEQYCWKVAGRKAFPAMYRKEPGGRVRAPFGWEQELLEACLRALPDFVQAPKSRRKVQVPVATGKLAVVLSWVS